MNRMMVFWIMAAFLLSVGQTTVDLSGTVKNQANFSVRNLEVSLKTLGLKATTDTAGNFRIFTQNTAAAMPDQKQASFVQFKRSHFIVSVVSPGERVSVDVFDLQGKNIAHKAGFFSKGENSIPLFEGNAPVPASMLVAVVTSGSRHATFKLMKTGSAEYAVREYSGSAVGAGRSLAKTENSLALDSIRFIRRMTVEGVAREFIEFTFPVEKWVDKYKVTLDMIPYEALEWGKTQVGRSWDSTGIELGKPGTATGIYPYEFRTYYNGAWCSEFHSYIMRIARCPLGTDAGTVTRPSWLKLGHGILEEWYTGNSSQKTQFIKKADIVSSGYVPVPGDFVHVDEHTATVRYMQGTTVYCLDGNNGNRVKLVNRGDYRTVSGLWGYGRRTGIVGDSWVSVP